MLFFFCGFSYLALLPLCLYSEFLVIFLYVTCCQILFDNTSVKHLGMVYCFVVIAAYCGKQVFPFWCFSLNFVFPSRHTLVRLQQMRRKKLSGSDLKKLILMVNILFYFASFFPKFKLYQCFLQSFYHVCAKLWTKFKIKIHCSWSLFHCFVDIHRWVFARGECCPWHWRKCLTRCDI